MSNHSWIVQKWRHNSKEQDLYVTLHFAGNTGCGIPFCLHIHHLFPSPTPTLRRSQWPNGLRRRYEADSLLKLPVRIPPEASTTVSCVVRYMATLSADPSSRGVLPTVVCNFVWSKNLNNETALAEVGLLCQRNNNNKNNKTVNWTWDAQVHHSPESVKQCHNTFL